MVPQSHTLYRISQVNPLSANSNTTYSLTSMRRLQVAMFKRMDISLSTTTRSCHWKLTSIMKTIVIRPRLLTIISSVTKISHGPSLTRNGTAAHYSAKTQLRVVAIMEEVGTDRSGFLKWRRSIRSRPVVGAKYRNWSHPIYKLMM